MKVEEEKWTIGKEILSLSLFLLITGMANFFIRDLLYDNPNNWSFLYLLEEIRNTFLVGILIVFILVPLNYSRIYSIYSHKAESLQIPPADTNTPGVDQIFIKTQLKVDDFSLEINSFSFARAEGNYVELHLTTEDEENKLLKRMTIKDLENQLKDFPWIFKTHRSYLVNLKKVTAVSGNAQGYQLSLKEYSATVPVSRGLVRKFEEAFATPAL